MKTKPLVTDQEVESYMDFDSLLKSYQAHKQVTGSNRLKNAFYWISGGVVIITLLVIIYMNSLNSSSSTETSDAVPANSESGPEEEFPTQDSLSATEEEEELPRQQPEQNRKTTQRKTEALLKNQAGEKPKTENIPYVPASPKDGYEDLYKYLNNALTYPAESMKDSIQGVTTVSFIINPVGKVEQITIEQSLGPAFDREAIRVIGQMPEWNPAMLQGKPVASKLSLPLTFQIKKMEKL